MLTEEEFDQWCGQKRLTQSTRSLIAQIRQIPPSRRVQGNYGNVCGNYCSEKMGQTIQFESHRGELAHIIDQLEHNREVLEYYDQPPPLELNYFSKSARQVRTRHTPDFFVIEVNWVGWEEFKPISELVKKAQQQPNRYVQDENGNWFCPPGEEYAQKYGLNYHYYTAKNRRVSGVYREFQLACSQQQPPFKPPSERTFREQIKRQKNYQLTQARQGSKIAKQTKPFQSNNGMPKDGELPWENAHIDHTCLDINLVSSLISLATCNISSAISSEQMSLGRCWATFLVDGYSKRILAVYLSFEPPSYRSCLMVIRICVKRFGRLPQTIITDNGKEFHSVYFKQLLAYYKCHHKYRPSGEPRYGSPVERVFGTTNTLWLHELQGNI
ncbi:DDE-type integrase/transposase/recombinase [Nostoc sp. CHAB 5836]|uniref:DDE-type integrase/transposase/recombinase n=1 Tax=Nostoc sp. CHAB 5836 TaxID=2780404 RepID=UPI001E318F48|nr:DDE-type integrase/transposase/recombinase [Nostoc sp. CHAB 5836]MCC5619398.1 DDE-type integrase/transposase/recombinase [Nostoc sp. CHAB 5836]